MRSKWKLNLIESKKSINLINNVVLRAPKTVLGSSLVNNRIEIYDGKKILSMIFRKYMVGKRLSNFSYSKYTGRVIHIKKKKRNK